MLVYHPMHMHLHAACDHGASMAMHMHNAAQLGMRYIWFTDHDTRTGTKKYPVNGFHFNTNELLREDVTGHFCGFQPVGENLQYAVDTEKEILHLRTEAARDSTWQSGGLFFVSSGTRHTSALAAEVTLSIELVSQNVSADSRLIFDVKLSQRPPDMKNAHILYVLGSTDGLEAPHTQIIPLNIQNGCITMPISQDASDAPEIGGKDNAFDTVSILLQARNGAQITAEIRDFRIHVEKSYEQVHAALKEAAAKAGEPYGITPFVSFEVSGAGEHKNCYTTSVPTIDYKKQNYSVTVWDAVKHIRDHGGIFAFNHPLDISCLKRKQFTPIERMKVLTKMQAELVANRAYGASLIEVGFPDGRNGFSIEEHLLLWDMLTASGLFLCGYGDSDSHRDNKGWFSGNNFAAYIGADSALGYPIAEEVFADALKKGNVYTGDPVKLKGSVSFETASGHPMGSVFLSKDTKEVPIIFNAKATQPGWIFKLIENGLEIDSEKITSEEFTHRSLLTLGKTTVNFQRAELWDETGRCILITNPICLINTDLFAGALPEHRIQKENRR